MGETSTRAFGRRALPDRAPLALTPALPSPVVPTWRTETAEDESAQRQRVPRARRAALLAGLVVGCLYMGVALRGGAPHMPQIPGVVIPPLDPAVALSAVAASGLLAGLRGAMGSLFIIRVGLNALGWTDLLAYALAGGALATVDGIAMKALGIGLPEHGLAFAAFAGAATATLFRVFAGVTRR